LQKQNHAPDLPCGGRGICGLCTAQVEKFGVVKSCQFRLAGTYHVKVPRKPSFEVVQAVPDSEGQGTMSMPQVKPVPESHQEPEPQSVLESHQEPESRSVSTPQSQPKTQPAAGARPAIAAMNAATPQVAIDIGTTTVAWTCFYQDREVSGGFVNPQRQFGADVMSRIRLGSEGRLGEMQKAIMDALKHSIAPELARLIRSDAGDFDDSGLTEEKTEVPAENAIATLKDSDITVAIAANTTMLHILNGWDCFGLGKAPFTPQSVAQQHLQKGRLSITELPGISAFIGADIVSGMYALDVQKQEKPVFFLDLGTNGEMAVGAAGRFLVTSAAAGPAFEASELALSLHASGLLRVLHEMLDAKVMDENGTLCDAYFTSGYPVGEAVVSQDLIRELQMAKAAIRAGIEILLRAYGLPAEEIGTLYLAGGMGYFIDPEDAIAVGLIPEAFREKIIPVGNTSLRGAIRFLREPETAQEELPKIVDAAEEILLAEHPDFEELYIRYMSF
jgi:uncharacterized 2Fe-2S/4Fe-4S cluster protein (DUF4445 family)